MQNDSRFRLVKKLRYTERNEYNLYPCSYGYCEYKCMEVELINRTVKIRKKNSDIIKQLLSRRNIECEVFDGKIILNHVSVVAKNIYIYNEFVFLKRKNGKLLQFKDNIIHFPKSMEYIIGIDQYVYEKMEIWNSILVYVQEGQYTSVYEYINEYDHRTIQYLPGTNLRLVFHIQVDAYAIHKHTHGFEFYRYDNVIEEQYNVHTIFYTIDCIIDLFKARNIIYDEFKFTLESSDIIYNYTKPSSIIIYKYYVILYNCDKYIGININTKQIDEGRDVFEFICKILKIDIPIPLEWFLFDTFIFKYKNADIYEYYEYYNVGRRTKPALREVCF